MIMLYCENTNDDILYEQDKKGQRKKQMYYKMKEKGIFKKINNRRQS